MLAGEDLGDARPTTLRRGRLRKRLRFLERERELLLRDLGGLVYEIHRTGAAGDRERHRTLVAAKVARLGGLDAELDAGLAALGEARGDTVLREPGIGGLCPRCGEIHGSDARFCAACGFPLEVTVTPGAAVAGPGAGVIDAVVPTPVLPVTHAPASGAPVVAPNDPTPADGVRVVAPTAEDPPTRVFSPGVSDPARVDETGEPPPADRESR